MTLGRIEGDGQPWERNAGLHWRLLSELLIAIGATSLPAQTIPDPEDFADGNLVRWERIVDYMKRADAASRGS